MKGLLTANMKEREKTEIQEWMNLREAGLFVRGSLLSEDELINELDGREILIISYDPLTRRVLEAARDLKLVASIRGGPEANIDLEAATELGIPVLYTIGRTEKAVSEYVILLALALSRHIVKAHNLVMDGVVLAEQPTATEHDKDLIWPLDHGSPAAAEHDKLFGHELYEKTLGLVGFGNIGRAVTRLAIAFGMKVLVHDPYVNPEHIRQAGAVPVPLPELMSQSDYVSLHARVTPASTGLIGERELRQMKPTGYLINTARAALTDESALLRALREKWFRGAALDVFHREPLPLDSPLLALDNVLLSPHLAGSTHEVEQHHSRLVTEELRRFLFGQPLRAVANRQVLEHPALARRGGQLRGVFASQA